MVIFSLFDRSASELSTGHCFPEGSILDLLCEEMFSVELVAAKKNRGKNTNFLNLFSIFPLSVSLFWFLGVRRCFPHSTAAANLPRSIVLLASFWTCAAINTVRCFLSEAGLQEDISVTAVFCYAAAHTLKWKRGKSFEVLEPNFYCDKTTTYDLWVKPINNKLHAHARPRTTTVLSLLFVQPQTNIASMSSAESKQFWSLCLLIWKWSLLLISVSCWLGFWRFSQLSSLYLPGKTLSMCGQGKLHWGEVQMNASVVVFGQFSKAATEKPSKSSKHRDSSNSQAPTVWTEWLVTIRPRTVL